MNEMMMAEVGRYPRPTAADLRAYGDAVNRGEFCGHAFCSGTSSYVFLPSL